MPARRLAPATLRNREPILAVLARGVPEGASVLEIASGSGEHAVFFAERLTIDSWQPTDPDAGSRASIDAWREAARATRVLPALDLDVMRSPWPVSRADLVVCINMIHIAPFSACAALLRGAGAVLPAGGKLFLYGPYRRNGAHTAPSNAAFDESLRARDPRWGVRDLEAVVELARAEALELDEVVAMPANNFSVWFRRG